MKFKNLFLLIYFLLAFISSQIIIPSRTFAQTRTCTLEEPREGKVTTNDRLITMKIKTTGFVERNSYRVRLDGTVIEDYQTHNKDYTLENGIITVNNLNEMGMVNPPDTNQRKFSARKYDVYIVGNSRDDILCSTSFTVTDVGGGGCSIEYLTPDGQFKPDTEIWIKVNNLSGMDREGRTLLKRSHENGPTILDGCYSKSDLEGSNAVGGISLLKRELGDYYVEIRNSCNWGGLLESKLCSSKFSITENGQRTSPPSEAPCSERKDGLCVAVETPVGTIKTNPTDFIKSIFGLLLGVSGGIALLLIIVSGYQIMASQGNPEKLQGAKERLTSAIVGLLFIIFSFVILEVIGVDILNIPGFQ